MNISNVEPIKMSICNLNSIFLSGQLLLLYRTPAIAVKVAGREGLKKKNNY